MALSTKLYKISPIKLYETKRICNTNNGGFYEKKASLNNWRYLYL